MNKPMKLLATVALFLLLPLGIEAQTNLRVQFSGQGPPSGWCAAARYTDIDTQLDYLCNDITHTWGAAIPTLTLIGADTTTNITDTPTKRFVTDAQIAAWGAGGVGPQGPQGIPGADSTVPGPAGPQGPPGANGADSTVAGPQGIPGTNGTNGAQGTTGNTGPQGNQGPPGADSTVPGPQGIQGVPGATGAQGPPGDVGAQGPIGNTGPAGPQGLTGNTGAAGTNGASGSQGVQGIQGSIGPQGIQGAPGAGSYRNLVTLASDQTDNTGANTYQDCTGLSFPVTAGTRYRFHAMIWYTSAATTTGSGWSINGPAATNMAYKSTYTLAAATVTTNFATAYNIPAVSNATSLAAGNIAILEGMVLPSANGTIAVRFMTEVAGSAVICKAGSTIEVW